MAIPDFRQDVSPRRSQLNLRELILCSSVAGQAAPHLEHHILSRPTRNKPWVTSHAHSHESSCFGVNHQIAFLFTKLSSGWAVMSKPKIHVL